MTDETIVEHFAVPEIFVDGFTNHEVHNGVMTCVGFRIQPGGEMKIAAVRLVWPVGATEEAIAEAKQAKTVPFNVSALERTGRH